MRTTHYVTLGIRCKMACWASYWFLSFTVVVFSLGLPLCFSSCIIHLRCTSEGGVVSIFNEPAHFCFVSVCCLAILSLGCIVYMDYVYPAFVPLLADMSCLHFLFRKCCRFLFCFLFSSSFSPCVLCCLWRIGHCKLYSLVSLPD